MRKLLETGRINTRVLAPVPWFPLKSELFGNYRHYAGIPVHEQRHGIEVFHPRYPMIPKIGMSLTPLLMATFTRSIARTMYQNKQFQLLDAHYFYPDGVAATLLGKWLNLPVVISARGTDINLLPDYRLPRQMIIWAAQQAAAIITVCQSLKDRLIKLGISDQKITVLANGVDSQLFKPGNRQELRKHHRLTRPTLLFVGNLISLKGVDIILQALAKLPEYECIIIGEGPEKTTLEKLAHALGVAERTRFIKTLSQTELVDYYTIADILLLPSSREGCANVLLEALSCGTPVIATAVGGSADIIANSDAGLLMGQRDHDSLVATIRKLFSNLPETNMVREYSQRFSWPPIINQQMDIYQSVLNNQYLQSGSV